MVCIPGAAQRVVDREFSLLKMLLFCTDRHYLHYFTLPLTLFLLHRGKVQPWLHPLYDEDAADEIVDLLPLRS